MRGGGGCGRGVGWGGEGGGLIKRERVPMRLDGWLSRWPTIYIAFVFFEKRLIRAVLISIKKEKLPLHLAVCWHWLSLLAYNYPFIDMLACQFLLFFICSDLPLIAFLSNRDFSSGDLASI